MEGFMVVHISGSYLKAIGFTLEGSAVLHIYRKGEAIITYDGVDWKLEGVKRVWFIDEI